MTFKSFINESLNDKVSNVKKLQWLLRKVESNQMLDIADRIIFDIDKLQIGFIRVKSKEEEIYQKYPDLKGRMQDCEAKIAIDAYKIQYENRRQELLKDNINTLKMNLSNFIFLINKIKDEKVMAEITSNLNYFIKGEW